MGKHDEFDLDVRLGSGSSQVRSSRPLDGEVTNTCNTCDSCPQICGTDQTCPPDNTCDFCPTQGDQPTCPDTCHTCPTLCQQHTCDTCLGQDTCNTCPEQGTCHTCVGDTCPACFLPE